MHRRLQDNPNNKRYFWSLMITFLLWLLVGIVIIFVDPEEVADLFLVGSYLILVVPLSLAVWFSSSLLLGSSKYGAVTTLGVIVSLYLRIIKIGAWWILVPWWGLCICLLVFMMMKGKVDKGEAS